MTDDLIKHGGATDRLLGSRAFVFSLCLFLVCASGWFFKETLSQAVTDRTKIEEAIRRNTMLVVGRDTPCITEVRLVSWRSMNELGVYRWVAECEDNQ